MLTFSHIRVRTERELAKETVGVAYNIFQSRDRGYSMELSALEPLQDVGQVKRYI